VKMKTIVDTSVWIEYFKNQDTLAAALDRELLAGNIYMVGPVISELLQGAKTEKDFQVLMNSIDGVPFIEAGVSDWKLAGELSYMLCKKGVTIPITDCLIGAIAINNDLAVTTLDQHFKHLPRLKLVTIA
jgi:tRNA(fMet)-specific endonuclease VapC